VTTSFEYERPPFGDWVSDERIPTPVRFRPSDLPDRAIAAKHFGFDPERPIVLIFGGGTGSQPLNEHVGRTKKRWLGFTQVLHLTGKGKDKGFVSEKGYVVRDLLIDEMLQAYAAADLVISRAGFATLSEMTAGLSVPTIVVPLPGTEQESNAKAFEEQGGLIVVEQSHPRFDEELLATAELLLHDEEGRQKMGGKAQAFLPTDDGTTLAKRILKIWKARTKN
jgi:UDP-N-acetylglucosamine:LPS N-acetylglucosamine transferase